MNSCERNKYLSNMHLHANYNSVQWFMDYRLAVYMNEDAREENDDRDASALKINNTETGA